jgi:hypothetical protein
MLTDALITFHADWRVEQSAPLVSGGTVHVRYAKRRLLAGTELDAKGPQKSTVTACYRIDGGDPRSITLGGKPTPGDFFADHAIALPTPASSLEIWFQQTGLYGVSKYDSDHGRNFVFPVENAIRLPASATGYVIAVERDEGAGARR